MASDVEQLIVTALLKIEMAADLAGIMAETDAGKAASAIAALQLQLEAKMHAEGDTEAVVHAERVSQRVQDTWVTFRQRAGEA